MISFVVGLAILPHFPDDGKPTIGQAAIGMRIRVTVRANVLKVSCGPAGLRDRGPGELLGDAAELLVTAVAELDALLLATL